MSVAVRDKHGWRAEIPTADRYARASFGHSVRSYLLRMLTLPPEVSRASAVPPPFNLAVSLFFSLFRVPGKSEFTLPPLVWAFRSKARFEASRTSTLPPEVVSEQSAVGCVLSCADTFPPEVWAVTGP